MSDLGLTRFAETRSAAARLGATVALDIRLQARNYLYSIGVGVAVCLGLAARFFLEMPTVAALLPGLWLGAIGSTTFMFVAGMILLEKSERTVDALVVTPLPVTTYLTSKVVTLTGFAAIESLIVLVVAHGLAQVRLVPLLLGITFLGVMYTLAGIAQVASQASVTDFLVPGGIVALTILQIPFLDAFGFWSHPALYVIPTQATVVLMKGAFAGMEPWQWFYGIGYSLVSIVGASWLARRRFQRHMVEKNVEKRS